MGACDEVTNCNRINETDNSNNVSVSVIARVNAGVSVVGRAGVSERSGARKGQTIIALQHSMLACGCQWRTSLFFHFTSNRSNSNKT